MDDTTATFAAEDNDTTEMPMFAAGRPAMFSGERTLESPALTAEQTLFDEPFPVPPPHHGDPAYLVEVRPSHRPPSLLAVRATLGEAQQIAGTVHPAYADVTIRELMLPCDAASLAHAICRVWIRRADGSWRAPC